MKKRICFLIAILILCLSSCVNKADDKSEWNMSGFLNLTRDTGGKFCYYNNKIYYYNNYNADTKNILLEKSGDTEKSLLRGFTVI